MIFKVYNSSNSMIAVYSITHSTYQKNFDSKVKSLHNSYTTDIHINKEQFGVLSVKFIITASDLVKIHKLYTFQANPSYRITFLDPETDFEYNIHCTSPFQQNRLGLKDVVSYYEFNLTADIIGLGAFPTYKTGDASFWTQWSERWEVGPVANQTDLIAHPYYSNKLDFSTFGTPGFTSYAYILENSNWLEHGDGTLWIKKYYTSDGQYINYDLSGLPDYTVLRISLNNIRTLTPKYPSRLEVWLYLGDYNVTRQAIHITYGWHMTYIQYRYAFYDGALGSAEVYCSIQNKYVNVQNPVDLWLEHKCSIISSPNRDPYLKVKDLGYGGTDAKYQWISGNYAPKITRLRFGFRSEIGLGLLIENGLGSIIFEPDWPKEIIIS